MGFFGILLRYFPGGLLLRRGIVDSDKHLFKIETEIDICNAGDGIRTRERLRDKALNLAPLTWLGNPRSKYGLIGLKPILILR